MTSITINGTVSQVNVGKNLSFEGLLLDNGKYAVAVPQIASYFHYFQDSQNQASQKLKRLMGKDFKTHKVNSKYLML